MNDLENRLTEALNARADLVEPRLLDMAPTPPAVVVPLHRRRSSAITLGAAAAVAAVAATVVLLGSVGGDGDARPVGPAGSPVVVETPTPPPTVEPTPEPTQEPTQELTTSPATEAPVVTDLPAALRQQDDPAYVDPGTSVDYPDGSSAVVEGTTMTLTSAAGTSAVEVVEDSRLSPVAVDLGPSGVGYRLSFTGGGESAVETLVVADPDGGLRVVEPVDDAVPYGFGFSEGLGGHLTFTTGDGSGLWTKVLEGDPSENRFRFYSWRVTAPGEGGGLVATEVGVGCYEAAGATDTLAAC